jgi:sulfonate transport system permease protein
MSVRALAKALMLPLLVACAWQFASTQGPPQYAFIFLPLQDVWHSFLELLSFGDLATQVLASLMTALQGILYGGVAGFMLAVLMSFSPPLDMLLSPPFHAMRHVPTVALIPLIILWFGNTEHSKVAIVSLSVFEVMVLNTYEGLHGIDRRLTDVGRALQLSPLAAFRFIRLPAALPSICTGIQHAIAFAWLSTVAAELLFLVGPGLGSVMEHGLMGARMDTVIVCLTFISILGLLMHQLSVLISRRLLRWRPAAYAR